MTASIKCPFGLFSVVGQAQCSSLCAPGKYSDPTAGLLVESCLPCPAGYSCAGAAATPMLCPAGTFCAGNTSSAYPCAPGSYNSASLASACQACTPGYYCLLGSLIASPCRAGTYNPTASAQNSSACLACAINGTYCAPGSDVNNNPCPAGFFCASPSRVVQCPSSTSLPFAEFMAELVQCCVHVSPRCL